MPDWSYRTLLRPILYRFSPVRARDFSLRAMGTLARLPGGRLLIDWLGHMRPDSRLRRCRLGIDFAAPIGLGPNLDVHATALPALERFGFGFIEVGPITAEPVADNELNRDDSSQSIRFAGPSPNPGAAALSAKLRRDPLLAQPLLVRVGTKACDPVPATGECRLVIEALRPFANAFTTDTLPVALANGWSEDAWHTHLQGLRDVMDGKPLLVGVPLDADAARSRAFLDTAWSMGVRGFVLDGRNGGRVGAPARGAAQTATMQLRQTFGTEAVIVAAGGVHEPADALALLDDGADLVEIDTGLVFSGPGLPKRCNEAVLVREQGAVSHTPAPASESSWLWALLMGLAMFAGGVLALLIAATRVVLPYDEIFSGMTREELAAINPRLLPFMAHDRVSLAGTMIAVGILYPALAWFGIRGGARWAKAAVLTSAMAGFASFFSFLGFGYFDPFHAFVTAVLFQFLLLAWHGKLGAPSVPDAPDLRDDAAWRRSQWGQLLFLIHGAGLISAGAVISTIGSSYVFVKEDLEFMCTTREALLSANPRLVPLVAHDRASFGGMLIASGLAIFLPSLWGFRRGARWVARMLLWAPLPAYAAAIGVHLVVGYDDWFHLTPAIGGAAVWLAGLALSWEYLNWRR